MNELQVINNTRISIKEFSGQRVVTFKDIDAVHGRPDGTARKRFNDNREHFIVGEDFFVLTQPSEIRTLGIQRPQGGTPESVTLVTESGYLIKSGSDYNMPTQKSMDLGLFFVKETPRISRDGAVMDRVTKVTPKGQKYFLNRYAAPRKAPALVQ